MSPSWLGEQAELEPEPAIGDAQLQPAGDNITIIEDQHAKSHA
jgi:hypothetical protein